MNNFCIQLYNRNYDDTKLSTPKKIKVEFSVGSLARKENSINQSETLHPKLKCGCSRKTNSRSTKILPPKSTTKSNKKRGHSRKTSLGYQLDDVSKLLTFDIRMDDERS